MGSLVVGIASALVGAVVLAAAQPQAQDPMGARAVARLRSSFLFIQIPDGPGWVRFREVLEANGRLVAADALTRPALEQADESGLDRWRRLSEESARYNLGSITRTLNVPTFALLVLHAGNQSRFTFTAAGENPNGGTAVCTVAFQETGSPTIIRSGVGGDVPSSGSFRIEPASGRVVYSELIAGSTATGVASKAVVRYERDRRLELWVPREMREGYVTASGERLQCVARYSNYRRAEVTARVRPGE
ncbi:MAG: hypothetical protein OEW19_02535 [Acidobacteriota bacterium]|nr:hypothetical protein [Acidobacteriota bacterium]